MNKGTKTVLIDDALYEIDIEGIEIKVKEFEFLETLKMLLTNKQLESFIEDETNRIFMVRQNRIDKVINHIEK